MVLRKAAWPQGATEALGGGAHQGQQALGATLRGGEQQPQATRGQEPPSICESCPSPS